MCVPASPLQADSAPLIWTACLILIGVTSR